MSQNHRELLGHEVEQSGCVRAVDSAGVRRHSQRHSSAGLNRSSRISDRLIGAMCRFWLLCCLALAPFAAQAGCYLDGVEWFCAPPSLSFRAPANGQSFTTATPVSVIVDAWDYAPPGTEHNSLIFEIRLYINGTFHKAQRYTPVNVEEATAQFDLGSLAKGSYTLRAVVMDQQGRERAEQIQITVTGPVLTVTQTAVAATPNPVEVGRPTTVSAQISGGSPTGSVTIREHNQAGVAVPLSGGGASRQMSFPDVGEYFLSATYSGDGAHQGSESPIVTLRVTKRTTTTSLTTTSTALTTNQAVTFTATVDGASPSGTVTFLSNGAAIQTVGMSGNSAAVTTSFASAGARTITAVYNGNANNSSSTSGGVAIGVKAPSTVGVSSSPASPVAGQAVTYTVTVGGASPTGTVQFFDGGAPLGGLLSLSNGSASIGTSYPFTGTHAITARYDGDANNTSGMSGAINVVVGKRASTTELGVSNTAPAFNTAFTITAYVFGANPTGTVTFYDQGVAISGAVPLSNGAASFNTSYQVAGAKQLTASYSGDGEHQGSSSAGMQVIVQKRATSVGLSASGTALATGQSVTFSATIDGAGPTGTVTFMSGGSAIQTVGVSGGGASLTTSFSSSGARTITAVYNGDTNNATSTSGGVALSVKVQSTVGLASNPTSPVVAQSVIYVASVSGASPTGSLQFFDGGVALGAPVALSSGSATLSTSHASAGLHNITARYDGDGNNIGATSPTLGVTVGKRASTTSVGLNPASVGLRGTVTLSASVAGTNPTGTITFQDQGVAIGSPVALSGGSASLGTSFATAGSRAITAVYSGDANHIGGTSPGATLSVMKQGATTTLSTSNASPKVGQALTLTATISATEPGGTVTFQANGVALGSAVAVSGGKAVLDTSFATAGNRSIVAKYSGDANTAAADSSVSVVAVAKRDSAVTLSLSGAAQPGKPFSLTANVTGTNPTGSVTFLDGSLPLGAAVALSNGSATATVTFNAVGNRSVKARYDGDANHEGSASSVTTVSVAMPTVEVTVPHVGNPRAGTLPGAVQQSGGKATYSVPIALPPGVAGMVPTVSLDYGGTASNGVAGVGWSIGGRSTIHRCSPTIVQDGRGDAVRLTVSDRLCLDGKRLVLVEPALASNLTESQFNTKYWAAGAVYRTELDTFVRVQRVTGGYVVSTRDGRTHRYGGGTEYFQMGSVNVIKTDIHTWALRQTQDRSGNSIDYRYSVDPVTGEQLLTQISWGANANVPQAAFAKVVFNYESRPDAETLFVSRGRADLRQRLKSMTTWTDIDSSAPQQVLSYALSYGISPTSGRSMLTSLQVCTPQDGCLPATTFAWGEPDPAKVRAFVSKGVWNGPALEDRTKVNGISIGHSQDELFVSGDFNGDGRGDLLTRFGGSGMKLYRSTGSGFVMTQPFLGSGFDDRMAIVEVGDFDGDGQVDVLVARANPDLQGILQVTNEVMDGWKVCYSRMRESGNFACTDWAVDAVNAIQRVVYDFNADGRDDLYLSGGSPGTGNMGVQRSCISTGTGFVCTVVTLETGFQLDVNAANNNLTQYSPLTTADLDGDGRLDFVIAGAPYYNAEGNFFTFLEPYIFSRGYSSEVGQAVTQRSMMVQDYGIPDEARVNTPANYRWSAVGVAGDINGDGLSDVFFKYGLDPLKTRLCISNGYGIAPEDCEDRSESFKTPDWYVGNIEGDGVPRVLTARPRPALSVTTPPQACLIRFGGVADCKTWAIPDQPPNMVPIVSPEWQGARIFLMDLTGDGHPEVVYYRPGGNWEVLEHSRIAKAGEALDRLVQVTNGMGRATRIEYAIPGDAETYNAQAVGPDGAAIAVSYPIRRVPQMDYLVKAIKVGNGQGGWLETRLRYAGAASDQSGRGYLGFARTEALDVSSGITTTSWYSQDWPFIGMVKATRQISGAGVTLGDVINQFDVQDISFPSGRKTRFPFVKLESATKKDLSGDALGSTVTEYIYGDGWGNATQVTQTVLGGAATLVTTTTTVFDNRESSWLIGLPTRTVVTKQRGTESITRTTAAEFDTNGQVSARIVEPDAPEFRVRSDVEHNSVHGMVTKTTLTWKDPATGATRTRAAAEVTSIEAKGRFALKTRNAAGHEETRDFDPRNGVPRSSTTANGVTTTWTIDGFGQGWKEVRADGTEIRKSMVICDSDCPVGAVQATVVDQYKSNQRYGVPVIQYFNSAGQLLRTRTNGIQGQVIVSDQRYDARGRLIEADQPHFADEVARLASRKGYDDLNRPTSVTSLDEAGVERSLTTTYLGLRVMATNAKSASINSYNDPTGVLERSVDANGKETTFTHDVFGGLTKTRDPVGNEVIIELDRLGRRTKLNDPDLGATSYEVDPLGRTWRQTSAKGQVTTFEFDALDRMVARHEPDLESRWVFDTATKGVGQLAESYTLMANQQKDYRRQQFYDSLARPSSSTITIDSETVTTSSTYDSYGRVDAVSHQRNAEAAKTFTHRYSPTGYLSSLERSGVALWSVQLQDASNRVVQSVLGNGLTRRVTFDPNSGRMTAGALERDGNSALIEGYRYDALGNVLERTQWWEGAGFTEQFDYDALQRIKQSQVFGQAAQDFAYDDIGNITSKTGVGTYAYPAAGQVRPHAVQSVSSKSGTYGYDANGNLVSGPNGLSMTWSSFDMPTRIERGGAWSQFAYGSEHQRARQTRSDGTTVLYLGALELTKNAGGTVSLKTYWPNGLGLEIDRPNQASEWLWTHVDRLGSVVALSQSDGQFKEKLAYDAWGKRRTLDGSATPDSLDGQADNRGFTGHEMLDNVDMVHMNGRVYDPLLSRFVSADPLIQDPEHSQSYNRYSYVWNNPTNLTDPTGFAAKDDKTVVVLPSPAQIVDALCKSGDTACRDKAEQDLASLLGLENGAELPTEGSVVVTYASQSREQTNVPDKPTQNKNTARATSAKTGSAGKPSDGPKRVNFSKMQGTFNALWASSFPNGKSQEQGGTLVIDENGEDQIVNLGGGTTGTFPPNLNVANGLTVTGVFHTHPYDASEGGYKGISLSGGDAAYMINMGHRLIIAQSGKDQFMYVRSLTTPSQVNHVALNAAHNARVRELVTGGMGFQQASREIAIETAKAHGLLYYEGRRGIFIRKYP